MAQEADARSESPSAHTPVERPADAATGTAVPASRAELPKVQPYQLPLQDLMQVASGSGLQWIHSQAERVAQAQAAIAAEPKPVHVPREPKPVVLLDEGPLILVETRKDLSQFKLPFEQQPGA